MLTRDERQKKCIQNGVKSGCTGTVVASTGFGKTRIALKTIQSLSKVQDDAKTLVIVPTDALKKQGVEQLEKGDLLDVAKVEIINSSIKKDGTCDLLVLDECHLFASDLFRAIFTCVDYKCILCLTGTLERLDGKEKIIEKYAPVCDTVTFDNAVEQKGVSPVKEYAVMLDVDLTEYKKLNQLFNECFAWFDGDFNLVMKCATNRIYCNTYAKKTGLNAKEVAAKAAIGMKCMQGRKKFVMSHPKKFEVAKKIIAARQDKKGITFSATISDAQSLGGKYILHSQQSKKKNKETLEAFNSAESGFLHSSKAANQGIDVPGLSIGIILSVDSSKITKQQRKGRICRFEEGKEAELFTLLIKGTQEVNGFNNSLSSDCIVIDEEQLDQILAGEEVQVREREFVTNKKYRY